MRNYLSIGVQVGEILLPAPHVDNNKWAVIACDQFTSQPEYWQKVDEIVNNSPSTLELILPEVYLNTPEEARRITSTQAAMRRYLDENTLVPHTGMIFVERKVDGKTRRGLMMALDLERYDFSKDSQTLIRATEGTIIDRLPPRIRIREGATLEIPHILVLIDDPEKTVIEPLITSQNDLLPLYDLDLMLGSGHLRGYLVNNLAQELRVIQALENLANPQRFRQVYDVGTDRGVLLFAVGDGNHSLATAKSIWEKIKSSVPSDHPARFALVEIENVHDEGLIFEPIHRIVFDVKSNWKKAIENFLNGEVEFCKVNSTKELSSLLQSQQKGQFQTIGVISEQGPEIAVIQKPPFNLAVGTLQSFLDHWLNDGGANHIDYVHGEDIVFQLGKQPGNLGFFLPALDKGALFRTVILEGSLPRKTFSMGEAHEKRFYYECRRIS